jgi:hypothetical protein
MRQPGPAKQSYGGICCAVGFDSLFSARSVKLMGQLGLIVLIVSVGKRRSRVKNPMEKRKEVRKQVIHTVMVPVEAG